MPKQQNRKRKHQLKQKDEKKKTSNDLVRQMERGNQDMNQLHRHKGLKSQLCLDESDDFNQFGTNGSKAYMRANMKNKNKDEAQGSGNGTTESYIFCSENKETYHANRYQRRFTNQRQLCEGR